MFFFGLTSRQCLQIKLLLVDRVVLGLVLVDPNRSTVHHLPRYLFQLLIDVCGHTSQVIWGRQMQLVAYQLNLQSKVAVRICLVRNHHEESKSILLDRPLLIFLPNQVRAQWHLRIQHRDQF